MSLLSYGIFGPSRSGVGVGAVAAETNYYGLAQDLRVGLDHIYGEGEWTQRSSGVPGSGSDIGPALSYLLTSQANRGEIIVPAGSWRMATPPTASELAGHIIRGQGSQASSIVFDANTGTAFPFTGAGGFTGGGLTQLGLHLEEGYPTSTATPIRLQGDATYQPDQMTFEDLYISALGTSYWYDGFFAYGVGRTAPQGIRVGTIRNMQIFRCRNTGFYAANMVQWTLDNIGCYAGTGNGNTIYLAGGGSALTNTTQFYARGLVGSDLNLTNCTKFDISGTFTTVTTGGSATKGRILAFGATLVGSLGADVTLVT